MWFVMGLIATLALTNAILVTWFGTPALAKGLVVAPHDAPGWQLSWRMLTAGFVTAPVMSHVLTALMGVYFLSPDLEKAWGTARFLGFLLVTSAAGFGVGLLLDLLPFQSPHFHPGIMFGPYIMIAAISIAWARMRPDGQIFLFLFPVSTKVFLWITVGLAALVPLFPDPPPEGSFGPLAGVAAGYLMTGPLRRAWLRMRLANYQRQSRALREDEPGHSRPALRRPGAPPLRVVSGGLEDELKKRKPPKDKRYLN